MDFEFDPKDLLYVRIDRRRKLPATILLRALGYNSEEILGMFFDTSIFHYKKEALLWNLIQSVCVVKLLLSILRTRKVQLLLRKVVVLPHAIFASWKKVRLLLLKCLQEYLLGRALAKDIADPKTGEILLECNTEITEENLAQMI